MAEVQSRSTERGCIVAVVVIGGLLAVAMCSSRKENKTARSFASPTLSNQIEAMPLPTPAPIADLNDTSVRMARRHLTAVTGTEGLSGAMIYSQNCYDALTRSFSWAKLDQCGGFDMLAVGALDTADTEGLSAEASYFEAEAAAGRYLAVAIKAGEEAGSADERLAALQRRAAATWPSPVPAEALPTPEATPDADRETPLDNIIEGLDV